MTQTNAVRLEKIIAALDARVGDMTPDQLRDYAYLLATAPNTERLMPPDITQICGQVADVGKDIKEHVTMQSRQIADYILSQIEEKLEHAYDASLNLHGRTRELLRSMPSASFQAGVAEAAKHEPQRIVPGQGPVYSSRPVLRHPVMSVPEVSAFKAGADAMYEALGTKPGFEYQDGVDDGAQAVLAAMSDTNAKEITERDYLDRIRWAEMLIRQLKTEGAEAWLRKYGKDAHKACANELHSDEYQNRVYVSGYTTGQHHAAARHAITQESMIATIAERDALRVAYKKTQQELLDVVRERNELHTKLGTEQAPSDYLQARDDEAFTCGYECHKREKAAEENAERAAVGLFKIQRLMLEAVVLGARNTYVSVHHRQDEESGTRVMQMYAFHINAATFPNGVLTLMLVGRSHISGEQVAIRADQIVDITLTTAQVVDSDGTPAV